MDRDKIFTQVVRLKQQVQSEPYSTKEEQQSRKAIAAALHALSSAILYNSELELQRHTDQFLYEDIIRATDESDSINDEPIL